MLTKQDLHQIEEIVDRKLDEKLEEKLEEKFNEKLAPYLTKAEFEKRMEEFREDLIEELMEKMPTKDVLYKMINELFKLIKGNSEELPAMRFRLEDHEERIVSLEKTVAMAGMVNG